LISQAFFEKAKKPPQDQAIYPPQRQFFGCQDLTVDNPPKQGGDGLAEQCSESAGRQRADCWERALK
jgi:hypothetical protein